MTNPRLVSQSFLGADSDAIFASTTVGIAGLGGGGSHMAQQLAHVGIGGFVLADDDTIELKNLNRLVGGTMDDVSAARPKIEIANRVIMSVNPNARVVPKMAKWQECLDFLRECSVIVGCVDSFREREELERFARRHLISYVDMGMDVHRGVDGYFIGGQVALSSPGAPCLRCLGIVTDERLAQEAGRYGAAGARPQIVWTNGVLASLAVGLIVQLLSPWHGTPQRSACCEFDGNHHVVEINRFDAVRGTQCPHYRADELGDAYFSRGAA